MSEPFQYAIDVNVQGALAHRDAPASESWWVGLDREAFRRRVAEELPRMRTNKQFGALQSMTMGPWEMGGIAQAKALKRKQERGD